MDVIFFYWGDRSRPVRTGIYCIYSADAWICVADAWMRGVDAWMRGVDAWMCGADAWMRGADEWMRGADAWICVADVWMRSAYVWNFDGGQVATCPYRPVRTVTREFSSNV